MSRGSMMPAGVSWSGPVGESGTDRRPFGPAEMVSLPPPYEPSKDPGPLAAAVFSRLSGCRQNGASQETPFLLGWRAGDRQRPGEERGPKVGQKRAPRRPAGRGTGKKIGDVDMPVQQT